MELLQIPNKELEFGDKIGSGGEGSVFKGKWKIFKNGVEEMQDVAIKKLFLSTDMSELKTLSGLSHPNIINVYGFVEEHLELCIVMELCQYSLRGYFEQNPSPLSDEHLLRWSLEAALPLEYLRNHNILHRDVKPENYVVGSEMVLKLTDFGVARDLECTVSNFTHVGTWRWMAPEVHGVEENRLLLSPSYDIYALGLVLWYLVERKMPYSEFESRNHYALTTAIINGKRPVIPAKCPVKLAELIQKCWSGNRKDRPTISQVIRLIKDVIASLETTGTLLRIEDIASVGTTGDHLLHLLEASGPSKTQAIPASQVDVIIRKTKPKAKNHYGSSNYNDDGNSDDVDNNDNFYQEFGMGDDDFDHFDVNDDDDNGDVNDDEDDNYDAYVDYENYADDCDHIDVYDDDDNDEVNHVPFDDDGEGFHYDVGGYDDDDNDDDNYDENDDDDYEKDNHVYLSNGSINDSDEDPKPKRIMHREKAKQDLTANELPNKCTQPSPGQEKSKKEGDFTLQVSAADKPQTQNISEKGNEQNKVLDKEKVQEVCLEDGPETNIRERKRRRSSSPLVIKPNKIIRQDSPVISESEMVTKST